MKKIFLICSVLFAFTACNPNNDNKQIDKDTTNYGNAGMTGTLNANGVLPVDSNKTLNPSGASGSQPMDTTSMDTTKLATDSAH